MAVIPPDGRLSRPGVGLAAYLLRLSYSLENGETLQVLDIPRLEVSPGKAAGITGPS